VLKVVELPSELTPDKLPRALYETPGFSLLESSSGGRYTIAAFDPVTTVSENVFETLREKINKTPFVDAPELPFAGGWIGYLSYEAYSEIEKKVPVREPDLIPKAVFSFYDQFYLYDHLKKRARWIALDNGREASARFLRNSSLVVSVAKGLQNGRAPFAENSFQLAASDSPRKLEKPSLPLQSNFTKQSYLTAIGRIKNYIEAGDCYQVNLSQRFEGDIAEEPYFIYRRLQKASSSPYAAYLNLEGAQILSSSPESFLELNGREVTTRPIKGTRRRGKTPGEDEALKKELLESGKDRAELLMITDLERNDLGKVCRPGSVSVAELFRLESYEQVHHLVATVRGELAEGKEAVDLLQAVFPGGSITGAPKIRAMEIIHELENVPRNVYCGAIGFLSLNGKAQFNVAIRTMICQKGKAYFWAGGGIVADSDPEAEYEETLVKASGMKGVL
jgi:para-aminobenzoate synthetase component 1